MRARVPAIVCLVLGAALLAGGLFGHRWATLDPSGSVGLLDTTCTPGAPPCYPGNHGQTEPTRIEGAQFARLGELAFVVAILAAAAALGAVHPRLTRTLAAPATMLAAGAVAAATAFVVTEPFGQFGGSWQPGPAWWLFVVGAALIAAGARLGPPETPRAWIVWLPLAIAAPALATTATSVSWWRSSVSPGDLTSEQIAIGPAMVEDCDRDKPCGQERLGDLATSVFEPFSAPQAELMDGMLGESRRPAKLHAPALIAGRAIAVTSALAAVLAAALAIAAAARRRARALAWATIGACAALLIALIVFEGEQPDRAVQRLADVHRSYGLPLAFVAIGLACVPSLRLIWRPRDQAAVVEAAPPIVVAVTVVGSAPAAAATIPPCPSCRAPMLWVGKRKAWLCTVCKARDGVPA